MPMIPFRCCTLGNEVIDSDVKKGVTKKLTNTTKRKDGVEN